MFKNILKSTFWFVLYLLASVIGVVLASTGKLLTSGTEIMKSINDPVAFEQIVTESVMSSAVPGLLLATIICIIVFLAYKGIMKHPVDMKNIEWKKLLFFSGVGGVLNAVLSFALSALYSFFPESMIESLQESTDMVTEGQSFWILLLCTGILVPIMEEIIFRYGIHGIIARSNLAVAYVVSSVIFGVMHGNVIQGAYATLLGLILAYVYTRTENLWYPIMIHMTINSTSVVATAASSEVFALLATLAISLIVVIALFATSEDIRSVFNKKEFCIEEKKEID